MNKRERKKLYAQALEKYGMVSQLDMVKEECAELIQAVCKYNRKPVNNPIRALASEIADVEIMCEQLRNMPFNLDINTLVDIDKVDKLRRLKKRLEE